MSAQRVAFITGAGSGIGKSTATLMARRGMAVVVADIDAKAVTTAADEITAVGHTALAVVCDVASEDSVTAAMAQTEARFGRLDALVCSAGVDFHKLLADIPVEDWNRVMAINVTGTFLCMKHAKRLMLLNGYGRMVCLGSSSGIYGMGWPAYSAAKAALVGLALSAARELAMSGITVNVVAPGPTETPLSLGLWAANPGRRERLESSVPVGRVAKPEEIAGAICYLASEEAGFVTGSTLVIDGGLTSLMRQPAPASAQAAPALQTAQG
jgi:NAD(P)-dependent dehydrogenase (short-subunit alcohol dehydrogenase family)